MKKKPSRHHQSLDRSKHVSSVIHVQTKSQSLSSKIANKSIISKNHSNFDGNQKKKKKLVNAQPSNTSVSTNSQLNDRPENTRQDVIPKNGNQTTTKTSELNSNTNVIINHHRALKKRNSKKCPRQRVIISLFTCIICTIVITTLILIPFLIQSKRTKKNDAAVLRWNPEAITIAGKTNVSGNSSNLLNYPFDLAVDWSYTLYVTDRYNNRVQRFLRGNLNATTVAGRANGTSGSSADALNSPISPLVDGDGNVYASDMANCRVMFWKKNATAGIVVAGNGSCGIAYNQLNLPHGLARNLNINALFVAEYSNNRVMMYPSNASIGILIGGNITAGTNVKQLFYPHGIFYDQSTNSILIANNGANNIVRWTLNETQWSLVVGNSSGYKGNSSTLLNDPTDVMLDPMNNIYVADRSNQRILFFPAGQNSGTTIAGINGKTGTNATLFNLPTSLALDNQLNLYVADAKNNRIQKFLRY